ncbi:SDR family NAD(P)-dependent oxidoreductase [Caballeronia novacaledonica]|uniref:SDR family oxidoreductase n=1 Tax=Caballeronia novacaledonica TaxID=1544861 RepID=A0AA37IBR8_9BURK|nr:SDR family oxidoreductase [Caballeronia novacaledonica]GJH27036.1 SDR family oxidoreductase [Caballeronia novacaledonica]
MNRDCIVVTGASKGIGAAIALALVDQGRNVVCLSRSGSLPSFPRATGTAGGQWIARKADVTQPGALAETFRELAAKGWSITGLVNNAGLHIDAPSAELALEQWHQVMDMNATSVMVACQAVYPHLIGAGGGLIVNIGSFFDKLGVKRNLAYCASKAAVGAMTRCLAVEWGGKGIRVMNVAPGYIQTDLNADSITAGPLLAYLEKRIPRGKPGNAAEVGALVASLFSPACGFLTGETIYVDGGQGVAH